MKLIRLSFFVLAMGFLVASCGNGSGDAPKTDTLAPVPSTPPATPPPAPDSTVKPMDTTAKPADMTKTTGTSATKK